jgi:hypothetical protein
MCIPNSHMSITEETNLKYYHMFEGVYNWTIYKLLWLTGFSLIMNYNWISIILMTLFTIQLMLQIKCLTGIQPLAGSFGLETTADFLFGFRLALIGASNPWSLKYEYNCQWKMKGFWIIYKKGFYTLFRLVMDFGCYYCHFLRFTSPNVLKWCIDSNEFYLTLGLSNL